MVHRLAAITFGRQHRWSAAVDAANRAIELGPNDWRTYLTRVNLDLDPEVGITSRTDRLVDKLLEQAPNQPEAHFAAGRVALKRERYRQAGKSFTRTLQLDPQHAAAKNNLGVVQLKRARIGSAAKLFLQAKRGSPELVAARNNLAVVLRTLLRRHAIACALTLFLFLIFMPDPGQRSSVQGALAAGLGLVDALCIVRVRREVGPHWSAVLLDILQAQRATWVHLISNVIMLIELITAAALGAPDQALPLVLMAATLLFSGQFRLRAGLSGSRRGRW